MYESIFSQPRNLIKLYKKNSTCSKCLICKKNNDKVNFHKNHFLKQANNPFVQNQDSTMSKSKFYFRDAVKQTSWK